MKIVFVVTRSDAIGGATIHVRDLSRRLLLEGHDVAVLVGGEGSVTELFRQAAIPYHILKLLRRPVRPFKDYRAIKEMREIFRSFAPDIISTHTAKSGFIGRLAARTLNIPVLYTPHGWSFTERMPRRERWVYLRAERFAAKYAARIIAVARYEREVALRYRIAEPSKLVAIHNGMVDVGPRLLANPGIQPPGIVMVARFEPPKDHALLVRALSDLKGLEWELNLVGNGPSMPAVRKLVESTGLAGRVHFLDERKDVPAILAAAQLFVLVTRSEGFPRSILEAMRAGLPVIASNAGGISEAVADGETGFVVPLSDGEVLKTRIVELITDPKLRVRMGGAARKRYERLFTFEHMYEKTFALYESLIGEQPARGARISFGA